ncbi:hypothetical protein TcCL_NonESM05910 [Trypanosoma cruzi]|nr:hypothetical protein TcCL_NonESM05910 [Trypanosoma cruzi]
MRHAVVFRAFPLQRHLRVSGLSFTSSLSRADVLDDDGWHNSQQIYFLKNTSKKKMWVLLWMTPCTTVFTHSIRLISLLAFSLKSHGATDRLTRISADTYFSFYFCTAARINSFHLTLRWIFLKQPSRCCLPQHLNATVRAPAMDR